MSNNTLDKIELFISNSTKILDPINKVASAAYGLNNDTKMRDWVISIALLSVAYYINVISYSRNSAVGPEYPLYIFSIVSYSQISSYYILSRLRLTESSKKNFICESITLSIFVNLLMLIDTLILSLSHDKISLRGVIKILRLNPDIVDIIWISTYAAISIILIINGRRSTASSTEKYSYYIFVNYIFIFIIGVIQSYIFIVRFEDIGETVSLTDFIKKVLE